MQAPQMMTDTDKKSLRKLISDRLDGCRGRVESIALLLENDKHDDALIILDHLLADFSSLVFLIEGSCVQPQRDEALALMLPLVPAPAGEALARLYKAKELPKGYLPEECLGDVNLCLSDIAKMAKSKRASLMTEADRRSRRRAVMAAAAAVLVCVAGVMLYRYFFITLPGQRAEFAAYEKTFASRLADLTTIKDALEKYRAANGKYPIGRGVEGNFLPDGKFNENYIPGLVPEYLPALPRDPRKNNSPNQQILYFSPDGSGYKLIAHHAEDCPYVAKQRHELCDPARDCWAYGFWTKDAAKW